MTVYRTLSAPPTQREPCWCVLVAFTTDECSRRIYQRTSSWLHAWIVCRFANRILAAWQRDKKPKHPGQFQLLHFDVRVAYLAPVEGSDPESHGKEVSTNRTIWRDLRSWLLE